MNASLKDGVGNRSKMSKLSDSGLFIEISFFNRSKNFELKHKKSKFFAFYKLK